MIYLSPEAACSRIGKGIQKRDVGSLLLLQPYSAQKKLGLFGFRVKLNVKS